MKKLFLLLLLVSNARAQSQPGLIPVKQGNYWSYIDKAGKTVITGPFKNAEYFSGELAAVRIGGVYGYINKKGLQVIKPQYDHAGDFKKGYAKVVLNGRPLIINQKGAAVYSGSSGDEISAVFNDHVVVMQNKKYGLYSLKKKWSLRPEYNDISFIADSIVLVEEVPEGSESKTRSALYKIGDDFLTPFDKYTGIHVNPDGTFILTTSTGGSICRVVDRQGKVLMNIDEPEESYLADDGYGNGLLLFKYYKEDNKGQNFVDKYGQTLFKDHVNSAIPFSYRRAFVEFKDDKYNLVDREGNIVSTENFTDVEWGFRKIGPAGRVLAFVQTGGKFVLIDTTGKHITEYNYDDIRLADEETGYFTVTTENEAAGQKKVNPFSLVHNGDDSLKNLDAVTRGLPKEKTLEDLLNGDDESELQGLVDLDGKVVVEPRYQNLSTTVYPDIVIYEDQHEAGLLNIRRGVIFKETKKTEAVTRLDTLDIDYMERAYCYASSDFYIETNLGGHGGIDNPSKIGTSQFGTGREKKLFLQLDTMVVDTFYERFAGHPLYLVNNSPDTVIFSAQDSRLYITMQAFADGNWKDIEYSPSSWCGNSYHETGMLPGVYWSFITPVYKGSKKVALRFKLIGQRHWNSEKQEYDVSGVVYSNTFSGSINPAQLWKKKGHTASGIMDSYND